MKKEEKIKLLYLIAKEYYINNKKQKEIAKQFDINRVQVSRYISEAKDRGMIDINIINPLKENNHSIKKKLNEFFSDVNIIIAVTHSDDNETIIKSLTDQANEYINSSFLPTDTVGFGWGNTMFNLAKNLTTNRNYPNLRVVPLVGGSMEFNKEFQANNITFMIADKFKGKNMPILAPFYIEDQDYSTIKENYDVKKVLSIWEELDKAVVGIGCNFSITPLMDIDLFETKDLTKLLNFRQVGDILTHYFNIEGEFCNLDIYDNLINLPIEMLKDVNEVIAVAGGTEKAESIIGALRTGMVDTIIMDNLVANKIIEIL